MDNDDTFLGYCGRFFSRLFKDGYEWPRDNIFLAFVMAAVPAVGAWLRDPSHTPDWPTIKTAGWLYLAIFVIYAIYHVIRTPWKLDVDRSTEFQTLRGKKEAEEKRNQKPDLHGDIDKVMIGKAVDVDGQEPVNGSAVLIEIRAWNLIQMPEFSVYRYELDVTIDRSTGPVRFTGTQDGWTIMAGTRLIPIGIEKLRPMRYIDPQLGRIGFYVEELPPDTTDFTSIVLTLVDAHGGKHPVSLQYGKFIPGLIVGQMIPKT